MLARVVCVSRSGKRIIHGHGADSNCNLCKSWIEFSSFTACSRRDGILVVYVHIMSAGLSERCKWICQFWWQCFTTLRLPHVITHASVCTTITWHRVHYYYCFVNSIESSCWLLLVDLEVSVLCSATTQPRFVSRLQLLMNENIGIRCITIHEHASEWIRRDSEQIYNSHANTMCRRCCRCVCDILCVRLLWK